MPIKNILNKLKTSEVAEDYVELGAAPEGEEQAGRLLIEIEKLRDFADSDRVQRKMREGKILLIKMKELKEKDTTELKRAVEKLKKTCTAINGDIAGIGDDWIVVTPAAARIHREPATE